MTPTVVWKPRSPLASVPPALKATAWQAGKSLPSGLLRPALMPCKLYSFNKYRILGKVLLFCAQNLS